MVGLANIGDVLPRGQVKGGQAVGGMAGIVGTVRHKRCQSRYLIPVLHLFGGNAQVVHEHFARDGDFSGNASATAFEHVDRGSFLFRIKIAREHIVAHVSGVIFAYPFTGKKGGSAGHVLSGRIARGVVKARGYEVVCVVVLNLKQFTDRGSALSLCFYLVKVGP